MNYITECLEHMVKFQAVANRDPVLRGDACTIRRIMGDLLNARKFLLPPPNALNVKATRTALKFLRLPYPICAFEYSCPMARDEGVNAAIPTSRSTKRIALAYDCSKNIGPVSVYKDTGYIPKDSTGILVISFFYLDHLKSWSPSMGIGYMDEHSADDEDSEFLVDNVNLRGYVSVFPLLVDMIGDTLGHLTKAQQRDTLVNDVAEELMTAVRACLLLNTRNLKTVQAVEAPDKLNRKRLKNNRIPFFDYYTMDIFVSEGSRRTDRKKVNFGAIRDMFANAHTTRRWGTVIGHFKTRKTGIWWWNEHSRGNKANGVVEKDYRVIEKEL